MPSAITLQCQELGRQRHVEAAQRKASDNFNRAKQLVDMVHATLLILNRIESVDERRKTWMQLKRIYENAGFEL